MRCLAVSENEQVIVIGDRRRTFLYYHNEEQRQLLSLHFGCAVCVISKDCQFVAFRVPTGLLIERMVIDPDTMRIKLKLLGQINHEHFRYRRVYWQCNCLVIDKKDERLLFNPSTLSISRVDTSTSVGKSESRIIAGDTMPKPITMRMPVARLFIGETKSEEKEKMLSPIYEVASMSDDYWMCEEDFSLDHHDTSGGSNLEQQRMLIQCLIECTPLNDSSIIVLIYHLCEADAIDCRMLYRIIGDCKK